MIRFWDRMRKALRPTPDAWTEIVPSDWHIAEQELARWNREHGTHLRNETPPGSMRWRPKH